MRSVVDPELRAWLHSADEMLDRLDEIDLAPHDHKDAAPVIKRLERIGRRLDAARVRAHTELDDSGVWTVDGFFSAKVMSRHHCRLSGPEASRRASMSRALRELPQFEAAFAAGSVGVDQVARVARVFANKRVREKLLCVEGTFLAVARARSFTEFSAFVADWERLVDEDGTADDGEATHRNRDVRIDQEFNGGYRITGRLGSLDGAMAEEVLRHFAHSEFLLDWEKAEAEHGKGNVTKDVLERTDAQRRADALMAALRAGACNRGSGGRAGFTVNLVLDQATFEREIAKMYGGTVEPRDPFDPSFDSRTLNGRRVDPTQAAVAAVVHGFRRVVLDARGVVVDKGRRSRFFTGASKLAIQLVDTQCTFVGCEIDAMDCQAGHLQPFWGDPDRDDGGGHTNPENGALECPRHNRFKHVSHYRTWRDHDGRWHTYRPDGSEVD